MSVNSFGTENVAEKSNYNIFEIKWFDEFLSAYKIDNVIRPSAADVEAYRGKLPDFLLRFWTDHGWCSWSDGQYWLCNPSLPKPVLDYVFRGDPELDPKEMYAFGYTAFGEIDIWYGDAMIRLNLPRGEVAVDNRGYNEEYQRRWTDEVMLGLCFSGRFAPVTPPWEDENQKNMMPQALETLGPLAWGQIYGFAPAVSLGGRKILKNLQKMPLVEHLVFLASMEPPTYYDYTPPARGERGLGTVTPRRTIGPQSR
nr:GAD-like domain-containing protein [Rhizobium sp. BK212]